MRNAFVGHVNWATIASGRATYSSGNTIVAPSRRNPSRGTGTLTADSGSEFSSAPTGQLRFYFPRRANNQIAAGAILNCTSYIGTPTDPSRKVRADEFVRRIVGRRGYPSTFPLQHRNLTPNYFGNLNPGDLGFDTTNYSTALGNYSLYYQQVEVENPPPPPPPPPPVIGPYVPPVTIPGPPPVPDYRGIFPDDRYLDDLHEQHREDVGSYNPYGVYYEGYDHYGRLGESIFSYRFGYSDDDNLDEVSQPETTGEGGNFRYEGYDHYGEQGQSTFNMETGNKIDSGVGGGEGSGAGAEEDVLKKHKRQLEETEEEEKKEEEKTEEGEKTEGAGTEETPTPAATPAESTEPDPFG